MTDGMDTNIALHLLLLVAGVAGGLLAVMLAIYMLKWCSPEKEHEHSKPTQRGNRVVGRVGRESTLRRQSMALLPCEPLLERFSPAERKMSKKEEAVGEDASKCDQQKSILFDFANDTRKIAQVFPLMRPHSIAPPTTVEPPVDPQLGEHSTQQQEAIATPDATARKQSEESRTGRGEGGMRAQRTTSAQTPPEFKELNGNFEKDEQPPGELFPTIQQSGEVAGPEKKPARALTSGTRAPMHRHPTFDYTHDASSTTNHCGFHFSKGRVHGWPTPDGKRRRLPSTEHMAIRQWVPVGKSAEGVKGPVVDEPGPSAQRGRRVFKAWEGRPSSLDPVEYGAELDRPLRPPALAPPGWPSGTHFGTGRTSPNRKMQLLRSGVATGAASGWYLPRKQASSPLPYRGETILEGREHPFSRSWNVPDERFSFLHRQSRVHGSRDEYSPTPVYLGSDRLEVLAPWQLNRPLYHTSTISHPLIPLFPASVREQQSSTYRSHPGFFTHFPPLHPPSHGAAYTGWVESGRRSLNQPEPPHHPPPWSSRYVTEGMAVTPMPVPEVVMNRQVQRLRQRKWSSQREPTAHKPHRLLAPTISLYQPKENSLEEPVSTSFESNTSNTVPVPHCHTASRGQLSEKRKSFKSSRLVSRPVLESSIDSSEQTTDRTKTSTRLISSSMDDSLKSEESDRWAYINNTYHHGQANGPRSAPLPQRINKVNHCPNMRRESSFSEPHESYLHHLLKQALHCM